MSEEFNEYRRNRNRRKEKIITKRPGSKKILYQLTTSIIILIFIFCINISENPFSKKINKHIKNAFLYTIDTSHFTDAVGNLLNLSKDKGVIENETEESQNTPVKDF